MTSTRWCTAPATCRSTRRSTRASAPTWWAPASCSTGSARPAPTSTTCTSPRRTSPGAAAAPSPRGRWTTRSTSPPSWPGVSGSARRSSTARRSTEVLIRERRKAERTHSRAGNLTAARADRGGPPAVGQGRAGADRHRARPQPRLDRLLHLHQGPRRARRGGVRARPPGLDRAAQHRGVGAREAASGLDRGLQDGRAADPGLRPRRAAGVPRGGRHGGRHRAGRPRGGGDRRGAGPPAGGRRGGVLPRRLRAPQPADVPGPLRQRARLLRRPPVHRSATGGRRGCPTGGSRARRRSNGCS